MRKYITIFTTLLLSTMSIGQVIACVNPFLDSNIIRVTIVTDGHTINDHSFNESSYNGALKFKNEFDKWSNSGNEKVPLEYKNKHIVISVVQPTTTDLYTLIQAYQTSVAMASQVTVASGFIQYSALVNAQTIALKNKMRYVYIDGDTPNSVVPPENKDLGGILYKAEQSGFMAGIAGCVWLTAHNQEYGGLNNLKISTYGGQNIAAVTNYMYGFYWALQLFNESSINSKFATFSQTLLSWVKTLNPEFNGQLPTIKFISLPNQFSGDFNQSSDGSKGINNALVAQGAQIIFPVSGPQAADTISALQTKGNGKVIGVDTDQQQKFPEAADRFITSALKDILDSLYVMLWKSIGLEDTGDHKSLTKDQISDIFNKNATYQGGKNFTGIADNEAVHPIYESIMSNDDINLPGGFLDQLSVGWQEVLAHGSDFWNIGKTVNPFKF